MGRRIGSRHAAANLHMLIRGLILFFALSGSFSASAMTRVFDVTFQGKKFYAIVLNPLRQAPVRVGISRLGGPGSELGTQITDTTVDGRPIDHNYSVLEYLFYSGQAINLGKMNAETLGRVASAQFEEDLVHTLEQHLFEALEEWSIRQYRRRGRISGDLEERIRREFKEVKDGYGWIAILDENKNVLSTLAVAARSRKAPQLPMEKSLNVEIGDLPYSETNQYPIIGRPIHSLKPLAPILTLELKRFISTRNSPFYALPIMLYFGERGGILWQGPQTRFDKLYQGQPFDETRGVQRVAGRYVLESDAKAAEIYMKPPFSFAEPLVHGEDRVFAFSRAQLLKMFENSLDVNGGRISGLSFFEHAEIRGGQLADPVQTGHRQLMRDYPKPTFAEFKSNIIKTFCEELLSHQ